MPYLLRKIALWKAILVHDISPNESTALMFAQALGTVALTASWNRGSTLTFFPDFGNVKFTVTKSPDAALLSNATQGNSSTSARNRFLGTRVPEPRSTIAEPRSFRE